MLYDCLKNNFMINMDDNKIVTFEFFRFDI